MLLRSFMISLFVFSTLLAGGKIRDFKLQDINFQERSFSELQGEKLTIIDFWATWCKPCLKAIPKLNKLYENYSDQGVEIIGINVDSPRNTAKVKPFSRTYKIQYPVLRDPNSEISTELNVSQYPTLFIVNAENEIVFTHVGFLPGDEKMLQEELDKLLDE